MNVNVTWSSLIISTIYIEKQILRTIRRYIKINSSLYIDSIAFSKQSSLLMLMPFHVKRKLEICYTNREQTKTNKKSTHIQTEKAKCPIKSIWMWIYQHESIPNFPHENEIFENAKAKHKMYSFCLPKPIKINLTFFPSEIMCNNDSFQRSLIGRFVLCHIFNIPLYRQNAYNEYIIIICILYAANKNKP